MVLEKIGKYKIIDKIGTGAMGVVYKGFDAKMGRYVAIKTMSPQYVNNDESRARFYREAIAPAKLFHPNIVAIYDLDEEEGTPFIVMEFLDGPDLKYFRSAKIKFTIPQILNILIQVSEGLDYAHKRGIIHRDVKPANILLLKNGTAKIVDFGIARVTESTQQTRTGVAMGTPAYMSPEQAKGMKVDHRTDLYSVGVIAYELISGQNPFQAENYTGVLYKIINHFPTPLCKEVPECPAELSTAVMRCLEKERDDRFTDLKAFSKAMQGILAAYAAESSRLDLTLQGVEGLETGALQEPYKARLIRKYIKELQFEAASKLLDKLKTEHIDATLLQSLHTELREMHARKRVTDLLKLGTDLAEGGDYDLALANFNEILELDPDNVEAITWVQKVRRLQKEKVFKEQIQPLLEQARARTGTGAYLEAIELLGRIATLDPEYLEVRALIEENERLLARANQVRGLTGEVQAALRQANLPSAFTRLAELEALAPDEAATRKSRTAVWQRFLADFKTHTADIHDRDRLLDLRDWLQGSFTQRPVVAFCSSAAHAQEREELLQEIRHVVTGWLQAQNLDPAQLLLRTLMPVFPKQSLLQSLAVEVESLRQTVIETRQRQLAMEQKLSEGIQEVHQLLQTDRLDEAQRSLQQLGRMFPNDAALAPLREEVAAVLARRDAERKLQQQLEGVRRLLQADAVDQAATELAALESAHGRHAEVIALRTAVDERTRELREQAEIRRFRTEIQSLKSAGRIDPAIALAREASQRFPEEAVFLPLLRELQERKEELARHDEIRAKQQEIQEHLQRQQFLQASKLAYDLKNRFADHPDVIAVLKLFHDQRGEHIRNAIASAQSFTANKAFDEARGLLERAAAECPDSVDLQNAIQETAVAQTVQGGIGEVRAHVVDKKYDLALATLEGLLARYPEQGSIVRLYGEVRQQRNAYIQETVQHAQAFARDGDFDRGLSLLRTALEIVPNATEIQDNLEEMDRLRESIVRQRREAVEEARLVEAEIERAVTESRKQQHAGNLFDALRVLEETRHRFPKAAPQLEGAIQEIQETINLQKHLPEIALPAPVRRLPLWLLIALAALVVGGVVGLVMYLLRPAPAPGPAPAKPAVLAIDLRPWGEVDAVIRLDTNTEIDLTQKVTPLQLELDPGRYKVVYHFAGQPARSASEELQLEDSGYRVLKKVAPQLEQNLDRTVDELIGQ